jgi:hypothetical protein
MWAATAWEDADWEVPARGWTVMRRLRQQQAQLGRAAKREQRDTPTAGLMIAASTAEDWNSSMASVWTGGPIVTALLFAHPDSQAIRTLDARGEYFDIRSGDTWDLFFPGYHKSDNPGTERQAGGQPVGRGFARQWFFNERDFDLLQRELAKADRSAARDIAVAALGGIAAALAKAGLGL